MKIGIKSKLLRESLGITQEQLGIKIGCTRQNIWMFENGKSNSGYLLREYLRLGLEVTDEDEWY